MIATPSLSGTRLAVPSLNVVPLGTASIVVIDSPARLRGVPRAHFGHDTSFGYKVKSSGLKLAGSLWPVNEYFNPPTGGPDATVFVQGGRNFIRPARSYLGRAA